MHISILYLSNTFHIPSCSLKPFYKNFPLIKEETFLSKRISLKVYIPPLYLSHFDPFLKKPKD